MKLMSINEAWETLGVNIEKIYDILSSTPRLKRGDAAKSEYEKAKKLARDIMVINHPDKNPDDKNAENKFKRIGEALRSIEIYTNEFVESLENKLKDEQDLII